MNGFWPDYELTRHEFLTRLHKINFLFFVKSSSARSWALPDIIIELRGWLKLNADIYIYISRITLNSQETRTLNLSSGVVFFFCLSSVSPGNWTETDNLSRIYPLISKISFFKRSSEHQESSDLVFISNFLYKVVFHSCLAHTSR